MKKSNKFIFVITSSVFLATVFNNSYAHNPDTCTFELNSVDTGSATVKIVGKKLTVSVNNARPEAMYTVWIDFKSRATGLLANDYPLDKGALGRGVAPAFATTAGVKAGMGLDPNGLVTDLGGKAKFKAKLNYEILVAGDSPVVGGELSMQGTNRIGGYWLRQFPIDPAISPSLQLTGPFTYLPLLEHATAQSITVQYHPNYTTHGHTPGVFGLDHFDAFNGDIPAECKES